MADQATETDRIIRSLDFQALSREISQIPGVVSCTIINQQGTIKGRLIGDVPHNDEVLERTGAVGAVIWGGLKMVEQEAGPLSSVIIKYEKFQVIGIPLPGTKIAVLVTSPLAVDPVQIVNRIIYFVQHFMGRAAAAHSHQNQ